MWHKKIIGNLECYYPLYERRTLKQAESMSSFLEEVQKEGNGPFDAKCLLYYDTYQFINGNKILPLNMYRTEVIDYEIYLVPYTLSLSHDIIQLKVNEEVINDFEVFKQSKAIYTELNLMHKRGVLLYGPPGTGKTSIIHKIINSIKEDCLVIFLNSFISYSFIKELQQDSRLKILIFEEFTNILEDDNEASEKVLNFLDGETSLDNCFMIATTNYPEKLPKNVIDRPGRFDKFYKLDVLSINDIKTYFNHFKIKCDNYEIFYGKTIAELKEIILLHKRDKLSLSDALIKLNTQKDIIGSKFDEIKDEKKYML